MKERDIHIKGERARERTGATRSIRAWNGMFLLHRNTPVINHIRPSRFPKRHEIDFFI